MSELEQEAAPPRTDEVLARTLAGQDTPPAPYDWNESSLGFFIFYFFVLCCVE